MAENTDNHLIHEKYLFPKLLLASEDVQGVGGLEHRYALVDLLEGEHRHVPVGLLGEELRARYAGQQWTDGVTQAEEKQQVLVVLEARTKRQVAQIVQVQELECWYELTREALEARG